MITLGPSNEDTIETSFFGLWEKAEVSQRLIYAGTRSNPLLSRALSAVQLPSTDVGKISFERRFPTHGGLHGPISYLAHHEVENEVQFFFEAAFQIRKVWTGFQYMLNASFQIKYFLGAGVQYFFWMPVSKLNIF